MRNPKRTEDKSPVPAMKKVLIVVSSLILVALSAVAILFLMPVPNEVLPGNRVSNETLEYLRNNDVLETSEDIIAYFDNTLFDDGTESSILTTKRVIYHCNNSICRNDDLFRQPPEKQTMAIALQDIEDVRHRHGELKVGAFWGDIIEIDSVSGENLVILIDEAAAGPSFAELLIDAWKAAKMTN